MQSSFRISKLVLSKFGTAASFGFGVNAGARYADSQSGHRLAIEEAQLRHLHMRPRAGSEVESEGGDREQDLDVDRSSLLLGYSCFSPASASQASSCITQNNPLVESKRQAEISVSSQHSRSRSRDNNNSHNSPGDNAEHAIVQEESAGGARQENQRQSQHQHQHQTQTQYKYLERKKFHGTVSLPPIEEHVCVQKECDTPQEKVVVDQKQMPEYKYEEYSVGGKAESLSWNSLVEAEQCSICADLLAVPVVTACQHSFCGICFLDLKRAHYDVHPFDCPNCRTPLEQGEQPLDQRRDARIAQLVAGFVQQQSTSGGGEEWRGQYEDWLLRREQYFVSTVKPIVTCQRQQQSATDLLDELDDLPSWDEDVSQLARDLSGSTAVEQDWESVSGGVFMALGMAAACCLLIASSRQMPHRSILRELAASLFAKK